MQQYYIEAIEHRFGSNFGSIQQEMVGNDFCSTLGEIELEHRVLVHRVLGAFRYVRCGSSWSGDKMHFVLSSLVFISRVYVVFRYTRRFQSTKKIM